MPISKLFWVVAVIGLAVLVRWPGLGQLMTADEENWMLRSAGFYHNLFRNGDTGGAFMTTHPGATAMWLIGGPIILQEQRVGFDIDTSNTGAFRRAATLPIAVATSVLIGVATFLAIRLFGLAPGAVGGILLALEPYVVGVSQIAHLDALLALLMLNSVLAFLVTSPGVPPTSPSQGEVLRGEVLTGIFAGLAMATKLVPAMWLFVFFGIVLVSRLPRKIRFQQIVRTLGFIFGVSALTFYAVWPALWFTADLGRSFGKDVPSVITQEHVAIEESQEPTSPASFYARTLFGRTTPFVLILSVGALVAMARYVAATRKMPTAAWLLVYAVGFLVLITLAAKKADRYALPALAALPVVAGWGLAHARSYLHTRCGNLVTTSGVVTVGILVIAQIWMWFPYAIAYNSPFFDVRPLSQQGWGEGLEAAAAWLNEHPAFAQGFGGQGPEAYIASWYPSVMRVFFKGKTLSLSSRQDDRVGFVVLYRNMMGRGPDDLATNVLEEFADQPPVYVVRIQGVPYVWVYDTRGLHYFPRHVGELWGERTVGQLVLVRQDNWSAVEIGLATFSSRNNTQDIILHVRENLTAAEDIRTVRVHASQIEDSSYHRFEFEPLTQAAGKMFYVFLDSPASRPGDAITVRFASEDLLPGEMVRGGTVLTGRDIAYKLSSQRPQE